MEQLPHYKEEMDFRDLLRSPRRLFGYSYVYFLGLFLLLGFLYAWNLNAIGKNSVIPLVLTDSSAFVQDIPMQSPNILPPVDVHQMVLPTPQLIARGREIFKANCASCHGDNGMGDGPAGLVLNPRPRNFHQIPGWTNGPKVSEIYRTLQEGIIKNGMASFNYLPPADRFALIHLIRSFHPAPPVDTDQEISLLETTYQLSKGAVIPAQIPVREAMKRLVLEHASGRDSIAARVATLPVRSADPGGELFHRLAIHPDRCLTACRARRDELATQEGFMRMVCGDPVGLGFRPAILSLDQHEWSLVHEFVMTEVQ
jgi:mono/diheme cytochrome c family protein